MSQSGALTGRPDYGLDAPGVVRNLFASGAACLLLWASAALGLWSGVLFGIPVAVMGFFSGLSLTATGVLMVWTSKVGKLRSRERLLDAIPWRGDEVVLDVGCGRGLMLVAAARRLKTGRAVGIDIWQTEDLSGNRPDATLENARHEGVADRVEVKTADMRQIPLGDGSVDVVVSCAAIHNLYAAAGREQALREIARVLKPGGRVLIRDIRHGAQYAEALAKHGCGEVRRLDAPGLSIIATMFTFGAVRPVTLLARKPG